MGLPCGSAKCGSPPTSPRVHSWVADPKPHLTRATSAPRTPGTRARPSHVGSPCPRWKPIHERRYPRVHSSKSGPQSRRQVVRSTILLVILPPPRLTKQFELSSNIWQGDDVHNRWLSYSFRNSRPVVAAVRSYRRPVPAPSPGRRRDRASPADPRPAPGVPLPVAGIGTDRDGGRGHCRRVPFEWIYRQVPTGHKHRSRGDRGPG